MTLREAAMTGDLISVELLLKAGKDPSECDKEQYTPLHWAAAKGHTEVAKRLLQNGAGLEARGGRFLFTPLHMAAGEGRLDTSRLLLDAGAQVNSFDRFYDTPMHWAAWFGHLSVVQFLVERGGNFSVMNRDGSTPRNMASLRKNMNIVLWLDELKLAMQDVISKPTACRILSN
jgi:ankyrin repeat protein